MKSFRCLNFAVLSSIAASLVPDAADNCVEIGNCYDNDCNGNPTTLVCTSVGSPLHLLRVILREYNHIMNQGYYAGCPCGYGCNEVGPCDGNGCYGQFGRCTANYLGCACHEVQHPPTKE